MDTQKGFSVLESLLAVFVVLCIGAAAVFIYHQTHSYPTLSDGLTSGQTSLTSKTPTFSISSTSAPCVREMTTPQHGDRIVPLPHTRIPADYPDAPLTALPASPLNVTFVLQHRSALSGKNFIVKGLGAEVSSGIASPTVGGTAHSWRLVTLVDSCNPYDASSLGLQLDIANLLDPLTHKAYGQEQLLDKTITSYVTLQRIPVGAQVTYQLAPVQ